MDKGSKSKVNRKRRIIVLQILFIILIAPIIVRLYKLQVLDHDFYSKIVAKRQTITPVPLRKRGTIYDCRGQELAVSVRLGSVYGVPGQLQQQEDSLMRKFCNILKVNLRSLEKKIDSEKKFVWIKRKIIPKLADQVKELQVKGIGLREESKRFYPVKDLTAQVLGFAGIDNRGLEGVELFFDDVLTERQDKEVDFNKLLGLNPEDGSFLKCPCDIQLTIDRVIQYYTEKELVKCCQNMRAKNGMAIVMEVKTGEILAMANCPSYNLNNFAKYPANLRRNRCITDTFEPGSVFKIFLAAAALEEGVLSTKDILYCENGVFPVCGKRIHDTHKHGWLTFEDIIKESSNIGSVKIGLLLGPEKLYRNIKNFGFGAKTGVQLPGEVKGFVKPANRWTDLTTANISFGHSILVTPLQLITSVCCLARGGEWKKPKILKALISEKGKVVEIPESSFGKRIFSENTCKSVTKMLERTVQSGTGISAYIPGYRVAGKTGTAQKIDPISKSYSHELFCSSFLGYFPADDPQFAILVTIDEPKEEFLAGLVAAPVFREIAKNIIHYRNVSPVEEKKAPKRSVVRMASRVE